MQSGPTLSRITIFPIKSLEGMEIQSSEISAGGCLLHDRELAITDALGNPIIGKTNVRVHTRNPETGIATPSFARNFEKARGKNLPEWSRLSEFGNHYYLTVDSLIPASEVGKSIRVGDKLEIIGETDGPGLPWAK
jgi:uncharacterized protein YcbX